MIRGRGMAALLAVALYAAGCAQTPSPPSTSLEQSAAGAAEASGPTQRARIHTELAAQYFARGQHAVALQVLRDAMQADSRYAPAYNVLGLVHAELREDAQAEQAFQRAIELMPHYSEAHNNYGWFLCERGRYDQALARFEAAVANPLYASPEKALANAGVCSARQGRIAQAEEYLRRALIRAPRHPVALAESARLHFRQGRLIAARAALLQLAEVGDLDASALWLGVRVERALGDLAAESSYATQLRRRFPSSQENHWLGSGQYDQPGI